jgi:hypothetical protein
MTANNLLQKTAPSRSRLGKVLNLESRRHSPAEFLDFCHDGANREFGSGVTGTPAQKLLALVTNKLRRGINALFPLYALELVKSVRGSLALIADLRRRTRRTLGFLHDPVNFTVLCDAVREPLSWRHLIIWFTHIAS